MAKKAKGVPKRVGTGGQRALKYYGRKEKIAEKKLRRILKSNGLAAAMKWATEHNCDYVLDRLIKS